MSDGCVTLEWALRSRDASQRMTCWLWMMAEREGLVRLEVPDGFPFALLYDGGGVPSARTDGVDTDVEADSEEE